MTDINDNDNVAMDPAASKPGSAARQRAPFVVSIIGLLVGIVALGLASIPSLALERPLPNPFAEPEKEEEPPSEDTPREREGGITLKYKHFSVNVGGKTPEKEEVAEPEPAPQPEITADPIRWFTISAIGCALIGLGIASVGHIRERHAALTVSSMGCCAAAITWQYFAIGIAVGAAAAAFLIVIALLGSVLN